MKRALPLTSQQVAGHIIQEYSSTLDVAQLIKNIQRAVDWSVIFGHPVEVAGIDDATLETALASLKAPA